MNHLSPAEFVDAAERALPPVRVAHLDACARCREQLAAVRETLESTKASDVPEPSPLYWQHFTARVRERVAQETIAPAWRSAWRELLTARSLVPAACALAVAATLLIAVDLRGPRAPRVLPEPSAPPAMLAAEGVDPEESEAWLVLTSAAADMPLDEAHAAGMAVPSGAIDRAVQRLSPEELTELGRLLRTEMRGSSD